MHMIGQKSLRRLMIGTCLFLPVLFPCVGYGNHAKSIEAQKTPLKTRLEWTKSQVESTNSRHEVEWSSDFKARYWLSSWWQSDRYLFAVLSELAPNVSWSGDPRTKGEIKKLINNTYSPKGQLEIDFSGSFGCASFNCVPFVDTGLPEQRCISFSNYEFASGSPQSEGVQDRDASNKSTLYGVYCRRNSMINITETEISEVVESFYVEKPQ